VTDGISIRLVLDPTAISAYAHGSDDVGEVIREVADEGGQFGVPNVCLIDAAVGIDPSRWSIIGVLLAHSRCVPLDTPPGWQDVAAVAVELASPSRAVAVRCADDNDGYVLSAEPDAYGFYADRVIEIA
jgi:hypothetical protein